MSLQFVIWVRGFFFCYYADDFVILDPTRGALVLLLLQIQRFLQDKLKLELHPNKVSIATFASGVDFLGWIHFPDHRVLRTATKKRMFRRLAEVEQKEASRESYLGLLSHGNAEKLKRKILDALQ